MSASFPNSWEPYGSSQQSQALAWRKPATRPAPQTFSQRWKAAHASTIRPLPAAPLNPPSLAHPSPPLAKPPQPKPNPAPSAPSTEPRNHTKALDLASFHNAEHQHRVLARYESIHGEIRDVVAVVKQLSENIEQSSSKYEQKDSLLREEIASMHAAFSTVEQKLANLPQESVTEQLLKRVVREHLSPLSEALQKNSNTLDNLHQSHTRLAARVNNMADGLFDRIANLVRHQFQNAFSTHFAPLLDRRITAMFEQHRHTLDTLLARMEDRINLSIVPYLQQPHPFPYHSTDHDRDTLPDDPLFQSGRDRYQRSPIQPYGLHEENIPTSEDRPQTREYGTRAEEKAADFDVTARDGAEEAGRSLASGSPLTTPVFDRARRNALLTASTQAGSSSGRAPSAHPVWTRLRIRPRKSPGRRSTAAKLAVIDLTKESDSDDGEEANFFEDGRMQCKNEAKELQRNHISLDSESSTPSSDSSRDTEAEAWSPGEVQLVENDESCARTPRRRHKSPYCTRSTKRRRRV